MCMGIILVGAYLALSDDSGFQIGSMFAFMMLSQRVSQPLVGLARLIEEWEEVGGSMGQAGEVLNRPLEVDAASGGLRPKFAGAVSFEDVTFTYAGTKLPALDRVTLLGPGRHHARPGRPLGLRQVDRSPGCCRASTANTPGFIKIDGADLREINLRHLRSSFGVVLQENFLFRGIDPRQHPGRPPRPDAGRCDPRRPAGRGRGIHRADAERL